MEPVPLITVENEGLVAVHEFFSYITAGSAREDLSQLLSFEVVALDPTYFVSQPVVTADGSLEFETALYVNGNTTIRFRLSDSAGNISDWREMPIEILPVNQVPSFEINETRADRAADRKRGLSEG